MKANKVFHHVQKRVTIAMSGGVDSSVAAYLLGSIHQKHGADLDLIGLHMSNWNSADEEGIGRKNGKLDTTYCVQSEKDASDAQSVCDALGMRMHRVSFASEYWTGVFEPFIDGMEKGLTTNPDVGCNSVVKFGAMREYAMKHLKSDYIATGHYARLWYRDENNDSSMSIQSPVTQTMIEENVADSTERDWIFSWGNENSINGDNSSKGVPLLIAGADLTKDQSYFLCGVNGHSFVNAMFPLGHLVKKADDSNMSVRDIAIQSGLPTASKKESMGICFIGKRNFPDFISQYLPHEDVPGDFIDVDTGEVIGKHSGRSRFTIGQGAKISGASRKWFVAKKNLETNTVFICDDTHHPALYSNELYITAQEFNWIAEEIPPPLKNGNSIAASCRTRHLQPLIPCIVSLNPNKQIYTIKFDRPIRAITPGQTAAIYIGKGMVCLGGGPISSHGPTYHELGLTLPSLIHPAGHNDLSVQKRSDAVKSK